MGVILAYAGRPNSLLANITLNYCSTETGKIPGRTIWHVGLRIVAVWCHGGVWHRRPLHHWPGLLAPRRKRRTMGRSGEGSEGVSSRLMSFSIMFLINVPSGADCRSGTRGRREGGQELMEVASPSSFSSS